MRERKIPILILALCIGGALLAGISSPHEHPHFIDAFLSATKSIDLWRTLVRALPGSDRTHALRHRPAASEQPPMAPEVPASSGRKAGSSNNASFAETAGSPYRLQTGEEARVQKIIATAFREYFRNYRIAGQSLSLRMPFALNYERQGGPGYSQSFYLGGKGTPQQLWPYIDSVVASAGFLDYVEGVTSPGDKIIVFELERKAYSISRDPELIESLRKGIYPGTATRIFVHKRGAALSEADVYNYLYAVASVGVDCSGFTFYIHDSIAQAYGLELTALLGEQWKTDPGNVRARVGLWVYDPASGYTDAIRELEKLSLDENTIAIPKIIKPLDMAALLDRVRERLRRA